MDGQVALLNLNTIWEEKIRRLENKISRYQEVVLKIYVNESKSSGYYAKLTDGCPML